MTDRQTSPSLVCHTDTSRVISNVEILKSRFWTPTRIELLGSQKFCVNGILWCDWLLHGTSCSLNLHPMQPRLRSRVWGGTEKKDAPPLKPARTSLYGRPPLCCATLTPKWVARMMMLGGSMRGRWTRCSCFQLASNSPQLLKTKTQIHYTRLVHGDEYQHIEVYIILHFSTFLTQLLCNVSQTTMCIS